MISLTLHLFLLQLHNSNTVVEGHKLQLYSVRTVYVIWMTVAVQPATITVCAICSPVTTHPSSQREESFHTIRFGCVYGSGHHHAVSGDVEETTTFLIATDYFQDLSTERRQLEHSFSRWKRQQSSCIRRGTGFSTLRRAARPSLVAREARTGITFGSTTRTHFSVVMVVTVMTTVLRCSVLIVNSEVSDALKYRRDKVQLSQTRTGIRVQHLLHRAVP